MTGINGKTTTTRFIAHILRGMGLRVGMTCTDGIYIDGRRIDTRRLQRAAKRRGRAHESRRSTPPSSRPPAAASSAKAWPSTAATWPWSPTSATAITWA